MNWVLLGTNITIAIVLIGAVAWLIKKIIVHFLDKDIENYKIKSQVEIEKFKKDLEIRAFEHQIIFSKLHETRAFIIAKLYESLACANMAIAFYIIERVPPGAPSEAKRRKAAVDAFNAFNKYFRENEIYFDKETCLKLKDYVRDNRNVIEEFMYKDFDVATRTAKWREVANKYESNIQGAKKELEDTFREILGVK